MLDILFDTVSEMSILCRISDGDKTMISEVKLCALKQINEYAIANEFSIEETAKIFIGEKPIPGNRKEHVYSNEYYKFVISVEHSPGSDFKKIYKIRRLSASLKIPDKYPSVELIKYITKESFPGFEKWR